MHDELEASMGELEDFEKEDGSTPLKYKPDIETSLDFVAEEDEVESESSSDDDEDEMDVVKVVGEGSYPVDNVKCYLRDIGKIPLLNKKTESVIAGQEG